MSIIEFREYKPKNIFIIDPTNGIRKPYIDVGEFLPEIEEDETEIARICLSTTTGDVMSVRARIEENKYFITIVEEYGESFDYIKDFYKSIPSQGELFDFLMGFYTSSNENGFLRDTMEFHEFESVEECTDFITFDSNLYPDLNELFIDHLNRMGFK